MNIVTGYTGVKHITAGNEACQNMGIIGTGDYVLNIGNKLSASIISNNKIRIADGDLFMQGRHVTILAGSYDDVEIANGAQGVKRNDIIVARYTMNADTSVEAVNLAVLQGTAGEVATDPNVTTGDIRSGDTLHEMPLYRVVLDGLTVTEVHPLFTILEPLSNKVGGNLTIELVDMHPEQPINNTIYLIKEEQ